MLKIFNKYCQILFLTLALSFGNFVYAGVEPPVTAQLTGIQFMAPFVTSPQIMPSEVLGFMSGTNIFWGPEFDIKSITNDVRLYIQPDAPTYINFGWELTVPVTIKVWQANSPSFSILPVVQLRITYDPNAQTQYQQLESFTFDYARRIEVEVDPSAIVITTDGNTAQQKEAVAKVVVLESNITIERYDKFDYNFQHCPTTLTHQFIPADNELKIIWFAIPGQEEEYDLEWVFVDNYDGAGGERPASQIPFSFEDNAARVQIKANSYRIPLVYEQGYIVYRLRRIGRNPLNLNQPLVGKWSCGDNFCNYANCTSPTDLSQYAHKFQIGNSVGVPPYSADNLNWQAITNYAENGKSKTVVSHLDGSMRNRQTITGLSTERQTLVAETIYDYQGRPGIQVLPAPVNTARLQFFQNFNRNQSGTPYTAADFDKDPANCITPTGSMQSAVSGASNYYSPNNPDVSGQNALIPDAKEYPFSRTAYTPDNTGRVAWQSGPGEHHKPDSGHETKIFYSVPAEEELDPLFGNDVGFANRHRKLMTIDPNGQGSIAYQDMAGNTIATALCGNPPIGMDALDSYQLVPMTIDLLAFNDVHTDDYSLVTQFTQSVSTPSVYTFTYAMGGQQYQDALCRPGNPICYDCVYKLEFIIIDNLNCGKVYFQDSRIIGKLLEDAAGNPMAIDECGNVFTHSQTFSTQFLSTTVELPVGSYTFYKKLSVDEAATDAYVEHWMTDPDNTCIKTLQEFIDEELAKVDTTDCDLDCEDAVAASQEQGLSAQEIQDIQDLVNYACDTLITRCETAYRAMLADMQPGGQYGESNQNSLNWLLSVYNAGNHLPKAFANVYPGIPYLDAFANPIVLTGDPASDILTFTTNWDPEWTKRWVQFHPEFCMWDAYCPNQDAVGDMVNTNYLGASDAYDAQLYGAQTLAGAEQIIPGLTTNPFQILQQDPFFNQPNGFNPWEDFSGYKAIMLGKIAQFAGTISMLDLAVWSVECPGSLTSCTASGFNTTNTPLGDQEWRIFCAFYMGAKERFVYKSMSQYAIANDCYNGCIGEDPYNPLLEDFMDFTNSTTGWWDDDQPCHWSTYSFYNEKQRRFPNIYDVVNTGNLDFYEDDPQAVIDAMVGDIYPQVEGICDTCIWDANVITVLNWAWPQLSSLSSFNFQISAVPNLAPTFVASLQNGSCTISIEPDVNGINSIILDLGGCPVVIQVPPASFTIVSFCCIQRITTPTVYPYNQFYHYFQISALNSLGVPITLEGAYVRSCDECGLEEIIPCPPTSEVPEIANLFNNLFFHDQIVSTGVNIPGYYTGPLIYQSFGSDVSSYHWMSSVTGAQLTAWLTQDNESCKFSLNLPNDQNFQLNNLDYVLSITPDLGYLDANGYTNHFILKVVATGGQIWEINGSSCYYTTFCCSPPSQPVDLPAPSGYGNITNPLPIGLNTACNDCPEITLTGGIANAGDEVLLLGDDCEKVWCDTSYHFDTLPIINPCAKQLIETAIFNAQQQYDSYIEDLKAAKKEEMMLHCLKAAEGFSVSFLDARHHFTLYYYDQSNNLVKTVPPKGVKPITDPVLLANVKNHRDGNGASAVFPLHEMRSFYSFTSLNQLYRQRIPDHGKGSTSHWYDKLGRMIASQNPRQIVFKKYSYLRYDALGRMVESGEVTYPTGLPMNDPFLVNDVLWQNNLDYAFAQKFEVSRTWYDRPLPAAYGWNPGATLQSNLRGRVAASTYRESPTPYNQPAQLDHASHYGYDIHGNVRTLWQDDRAFAVKRLDYKYDFISGNVNEVHYQDGEPDQFHHYYDYDADNRLIRVQTSADGYIKDEDAGYNYYKHGPLARLSLGDEKVQGLDYAYTIQGWIKGVNSGALRPQYDPGKDGLAGGAHALVAKDVVGYTLGYFNQDYQPIGSGVGLEPATNTPAGQFGNNPNLWNGNIRSMITAIEPFMTLNQPQAHTYQYDQLNRIKQARAHNEGFNHTTNQWTGITQTNWYLNQFAYDANGNITAQKRNGNPNFSPTGALKMDELEYIYNGGRNQLNRVKESLSIADNDYTEDIDKQFVDNYLYDATGNLIHDEAEHLDIDWTAADKVKTIRKNNIPLLKFRYDAMGQRLSKRGDQFTTFYVRDATGNVMATYRQRVTAGPGNLTWESAYLYGSARLGEFRADKCLDPGCLPPTLGYLSRNRGQRKYELSNHLGNVLATVTDRKMPYDIASFDNVVDGYTGDVWTATDYYAFGMEMPGRMVLSGKGRYGFNGQEKVDEISGNGNHYTALFWEYDSRLGRRCNQDPKPNPSISNYAAFANNPIWFSDYLGDTIRIEGSKRFIRQTEKSLSKIKGTDEGLSMYNRLDGSTNVYTIRKHSSNTTKVSEGPDMPPEWSVGDIGIKGTRISKGIYFGKKGWLALGHEMSHAIDVEDNAVSIYTWPTPDRTFSYRSVEPNGDGTFSYGIDITHNVPPILIDEIRAVDRENKIRAQSGMALRTHYGTVEINTTTVPNGRPTIKLISIQKLVENGIGVHPQYNTNYNLLRNEDR